MLIGSLATIVTIAVVPFSVGDGDGPGDPTVELIAEGDTIGAGIEIPDAVRPGEQGSRTGDCYWRYYQFSVVPPEPGDEFSQRPFIREHPTTGRLQVAVDYVCENDVIGIGWVDADPPPTSEMVAGPSAAVRRRLPAPVHRIDPAGGATVNLGLWLAVESEAPVTASASLMGYSATVTATHAATVFDMGDGTVVRCSGVGSLLTADDAARFSAAPGPCGHVYERPTEPGRPHQVTVTMEWAVRYVTDVGRGTLPTLTTTTTLELPVAEVQSIGIG
jgi:hypothetical protein